MTTLVPVESGTPVKTCTHFDLSGTVMCEERADTVLRVHDPRYGTTQTFRCHAHPIGRDVDALRRQMPYVRMEIEALS